MLLARTDPSATKHKGISCLMVDMHSAGIDVRPIKQAWGPADFNEVFFEDVVVPVENRIGPEHEGWRVAQGTLAAERAIAILEMAERLKHHGIEAAIREATNWHMEGGEVVLNDGGVRELLAECYAGVSVVRHVLNQMIEDIIRGIDVGGTASTIKVLYSELLVRIMHALTDLQGLSGQVDAGVLACAGWETGFWMNDYIHAFGWIIGGGTNEIQRNVIAERMLGLPRNSRWACPSISERNSATPLGRCSLAGARPSKCGRSAKVAMDSMPSSGPRSSISGGRLSTWRSATAGRVADTATWLSSSTNSGGPWGLPRFSPAQCWPRAPWSWRTTKPYAPPISLRWPVVAQSDRYCLAAADGSYDKADLNVRWFAERGGIVLRGVSGFVLDADLADFLVVAARGTDGDPAAVLADTTDPGLRCERIPTVDKTRRLFSVTFDEVLMPPSHLLCPPGPAAAALLDRVLALGVIAAAADATGVADRALESTAAYSQERFQFGKPIGSFQAVKHHCANMAIDVEASRAAVDGGRHLARRRSGGVDGRSGSIAPTSAPPARRPALSPCASMAASASRGSTTPTST